MSFTVAFEQYRVFSEITVVIKIGSLFTDWPRTCVFVVKCFLPSALLGPVQWLLGLLPLCSAQAWAVGLSPSQALIDFARLVTILHE